MIFLINWFPCILSKYSFLPVSFVRKILGYIMVDLLCIGRLVEVFYLLNIKLFAN